MIQVSNLTKNFDDFCAVNNISFSVKPGEVLGFLGPNGAGKSTTMKILTGFLSPSVGQVSVMGHDVLTDPIAAKREIGYLPEGAPAYADMTVIASLRFIAQVRGFSGEVLKARIAEVVQKVALEPVLNKKVENLSKGYCRRLGIAQALIHDPKVLILDEPTDGLDPNQKHQVRKLIQDLSEDKTVIVSTHILEEVSAVCTRAMILANGTIVFDGTPDELAAKSERHNAVTIKLAQPDADIQTRLSALPQVKEVLVDDEGTFTVFPNAGQAILASVNTVLHSSNSQLEELHVEVGQLDDVFREVTINASGAAVGEVK
jgi:gliding motility-associated transport system ATP-binding protein